MSRIAIAEQDGSRFVDATGKVKVGKVVLTGVGGVLGIVVFIAVTSSIVGVVQQAGQVG
jgi:hypothetical protein